MRGLILTIADIAYCLYHTRRCAYTRTYTTCTFLFLIQSLISNACHSLCRVTRGFNILCQIMVTFLSYISNACHSLSGVAERLQHTCVGSYIPYIVLSEWYVAPIYIYIYIVYIQFISQIHSLKTYAISHAPLLPQYPPDKQAHQSPCMLRPQKLHHRIYIKAFNYGRPLNHLLTHVSLVRVACGSNIHI